MDDTPITGNLQTGYMNDESSYSNSAGNEPGSQRSDPNSTEGNITSGLGSMSKPSAELSAATVSGIITGNEDDKWRTEVDFAHVSKRYFIF